MAGKWDQADTSAPTNRIAVAPNVLKSVGRRGYSNVICNSRK
ncbi:hypothetical protein QP794_04055 [Paenibacillus sp. UMB7766-LJ446]|nr:hypothetical protein [Paenibacillus sp. UMB7766-LJ446]